MTAAGAAGSSRAKGSDGSPCEEVSLSPPIVILTSSFTRFVRADVEPTRKEGLTTNIVVVVILFGITQRRRLRTRRRRRKPPTGSVPCDRREPRDFRLMLVQSCSSPLDLPASNRQHQIHTRIEWGGDHTLWYRPAERDPSATPRKRPHTNQQETEPQPEFRGKAGNS